MCISKSIVTFHFFHALLMTAEALCILSICFLVSHPLATRKQWNKQVNVHAVEPTMHRNCHINSVYTCQYHVTKQIRSVKNPGRSEQSVYRENKIQIKPIILPAWIAVAACLCLASFLCLYLLQQHWMQNALWEKACSLCFSSMSIY